MVYMMVRLQVRYGMVPRFSEIMSQVVPKLEEKGWRLVGAWVNTIGRLNKCYDLWELPDANSVSSFIAALADDPEFAKSQEELAECLEDEELEIMQKLPYSP